MIEKSEKFSGRSDGITFEKFDEMVLSQAGEGESTVTSMLTFSGRTNYLT